MSTQVNLFTGTNYCKSLTVGDNPKSIPVVIQCGNCKRVKVINPSCDKRNCERCNKRRSNKLFKKYYPKMLAMQNNPKRDYKEKFTMVTLTGFRIPFDERFRKRVDWFTNCAQKFLSEEFPTAGLMATEMTVKVRGHYGGHVPHETEMAQYTMIVKERELYIHAHAIVFGGYKLKKDFDRAWADAIHVAMIKNDDVIEQVAESISERAERFTWLERVHRLRGAFNYVLGYVLKGVMIDDEELEAVKRLKYVRSWGELYGIKQQKYDMYCADCHGKCNMVYEDDLIIEAMAGRLQSTLKIILVPRDSPPPWHSHVVEAGN